MVFFRDPAGARTQDHLIKSEVLYQLSYGIKKLFYIPFASRPELDEQSLARCES